MTLTCRNPNQYPLTSLNHNTRGVYWRSGNACMGWSMISVHNSFSPPPCSTRRRLNWTVLGWSGSYSESCHTRHPLTEELLDWSDKSSHIQDQENNSIEMLKLKVFTCYLFYTFILNGDWKILLSFSGRWESVWLNPSLTVILMESCDAC